MKNQVIAKPKTKLRSLAIWALGEEGFAGPNCNLDDISAYLTKNKTHIRILFYDMSADIYPKNAAYNDLRKALECL